MGRGRKPKYDYESKDMDIKLMYKHFKMSLNEIGEQLGIHPQAVKRRLDKMGEKTRNIREAMKNFHKKKNKED